MVWLNLTRSMRAREGLKVYVASLTHTNRPCVVGGVYSQAKLPTGKPNSDVVSRKLEVRKVFTLPQQPLQSFCHLICDEVRETYTLPQLSRQPPCTLVSDVVTRKIELSEPCALPQPHRRPPCPLTCDEVVRKIEVRKT